MNVTSKSTVIYARKNGQIDFIASAIEMRPIAEPKAAIIRRRGSSSCPWRLVSFAFPPVHCRLGSIYGTSFRFRQLHSR